MKPIISFSDVLFASYMLIMLVFLMLIAKISTRNDDGRLHPGFFTWVFGLVCLVAALLPVLHTIYFSGEEFWPKVVTTVFFGIGAIDIFVEAAFTRGFFDDEGIELHTLWTGSKREKWRDLVSVTYNKYMQCFVLTFRNGTKIRLSIYLNGYMSALDLAKEKAPDARHTEYE